MANFKVPRYVEFVDEFPLTGSNKISKLDLRQIANQKNIGG
jgi:fatty-acyl-CoA synthase